ncbi:MAG TPA: hypothetical protein PLP33_19585 [Leptospiraceae bacterium]|nr:hypothetical protein [Leptospiraceae bacterium]
MEIIKVNHFTEIPNNFTGILEYPNGTKEWYKEGNLHRDDEPAVEYSHGGKEWWIDGENYSKEIIQILTKTSIFLGKEKGKYNLEWSRFLTEEGIKEFPIILGMNIKL